MQGNQNTLSIVCDKKSNIIERNGHYLKLLLKMIIVNTILLYFYVLQHFYAIQMFSLVI
jgi:hypothetical protein